MTAPLAPPGPLASLKGRAAAALVALASAAVFFHRALLSGEVFAARDLQRVYYPLRHYWAERVLSGEWPAWYPYDGLGQPFVGMVISGALHPSNLLYLLFPLPFALKLNVLACFPWALLGTWLLARGRGQSHAGAALAAVVFTFNGYLVGITNNLLYLMAAATLPWALWAADRHFQKPSLGRALGGALFLALILFCGDSQGFAMACAGALLLGATRVKELGALATARAAAGLVLLTALLGAVQLLPALDVVRHGYVGRQEVTTAQVWSLHPLRLVEAWVGPLFASAPGTDVSGGIARDLLSSDMSALWVDSVHLGAVALTLLAFLLGCRPRRTSTWLGAALGAFLLLLALGKHTPVYGWVFELVPFWRPFRYPEKLFPYLALLLALGAGSGLDAAQEGWQRRRRLALALAGVGGLFLFLALQERAVGLFSRVVVPGFWRGPAPQDALSRLGGTFAQGALESAVVVLALAAALGWTRRPRLGVALVPTLAFAQLFVANAGVYELTYAEVIDRPPHFLSAIEEREGGVGLGRPRVHAAVDRYQVPEGQGLSYLDGYALVVGNALEPVTPALWGLEGANGYLPATSARVVRLQTQQARWRETYGGLFNAAYRTVPAPPPGAPLPPDAQVAARVDWLHLLLLRDPKALPRAYLADAACTAGDDETLARLSSAPPRSSRKVLVECPESEAPTSHQGTARGVDGDVTPSPTPDVTARVTPIVTARDTLDTASSESPGGATVVRYEPERVEVKVSARRAAYLVLNDAYYSGWTATVDGAEKVIAPANHAVRAVRVPEGEHRVVFEYHAVGFRLGLGVSLLTLGACLGLLGLRRLRASAAPSAG